MSHFVTTTITAGTDNWVVRKAIIDAQSNIYKKAVAQATQKAQHTMNASQAGTSRSATLKYQKQLMGTLAEIYAEEYIKESLANNGLDKTWTVVRYDDVRTDGFQSPAGEYDIRIENQATRNHIQVESRSSIAHNCSLTYAICNYDIIGPYASVVKSGELLTDLYVRPLYDYPEYATTKYVELDFDALLLTGRVNLYIVGGCAKIDMVKNGFTKTMSQGGTLYQVVPILKGYDSQNFVKVIASQINDVQATTSAHQSTT